jgi:hypothetical protein
MMGGLFLVTKAADRLVLALLLAGPLLAGLISLRYDKIRFAGEDSDGVKYVQAARNLLNGKGLVHSRHGATAPWGEIWEPLREWPPGYPILVAGVSRATGLEPLTAALWITRLSWAILPALFLLCLRPLLPAWWAAAVALLAAFSPGFLASGTVARTDAPFSVLVCLTLLSVHAFLARERLRWLFVAGLIAGSSYTIRTVGLALIAAVPTALLMTRLAAGDSHGRRRVARDLVAWVVGVAIAAGPLVVRNLEVFGKVQPYSLPPSTIGMVENLRWLVFAVSAEISGNHDLGLWIAWNWPPLVITILAGGSLVFAFVRTRIYGEGGQGEDKTYAAVLLIYAAASAAMLVLGRSTYQWGDLINERYVGQFTWIVLAIVLCQMRHWWVGGTRWAAVQLLLALACVAGVVSRAGIVMNASGDNSLRVAADASLRNELRAWAAQGDVMVSDNGPLLSLLADVNVRKIYAAPGGQCPESFKAPLSSLGADRALASVTLHAIMLGIGPCLDHDVRNLESGWTLVRATDVYVVLMAPSPR